MPECTQCGKKVGFFSAKTAPRSKESFATDFFCNDECKNKFTEKRNKEEMNLLKKSIEEKEMESKGMVKEFKCKCNQCGKIWHYLESREKELEKNIKSNAGSQAAFALFNVGAALQAKRNVEAQQDLLDKLKKCPECGSHDITKENIYYKEK